ncbi:MAG: hypothetical protein A3J27_06850 [Candidatus Tectomicrobia bacterium RIFCSPLOWO2_12_FULL_69_37]|nr:MAG: hypothetical protein A3I72_05025 [Candidatus Tectomicrobia bacterium RIFCSPLOWO2_02_FULL_70_19]OGL69625.1 MAG: hypothetical protein A3J27_06850 [Candidatus Tectomicrobia bacterium RIFCSPLOWO2_12_FULL_69_37]
MRERGGAARGLPAALIFILIFLGGCTTMRKTLDAIIEGRGEGRGGEVARAAPERPERPAEGGRPWAY